MSIRPATAADLDAITWIITEGMPDDPATRYQYPYRLDFPEDHYKYTRILHEHLMSMESKSYMVFESPSIEDAEVKKPVALALWQLPGSHIAATEATAVPRSNDGSDALAATETKIKSTGPIVRPERRDANIARHTAFRANISVAKRQMFDNKFGDQQLYLDLLACHPDYRGRGAGEMLVKWGLEKAKAEGLTVTLYASPMGGRVYSRLGFKRVGSFRTQVEGEEEFYDLPGMVLEYQRID